MNSDYICIIFQHVTFRHFVFQIYICFVQYRLKYIFKSCALWKITTQHTQQHVHAKTQFRGKMSENNTGTDTNTNILFIPRTKQQIYIFLNDNIEKGKQIIQKHHQAISI